mmetsp:Transcript_29034/g.46022  ORF Transcript_29034/g.46022 Transcript_29034/m.46022 type:complete len:278 (+) Transcript_29034:2-835(+)
MRLLSTMTITALSASMLLRMLLCIHMVGRRCVVLLHGMHIRTVWPSMRRQRIIHLLMLRMTSSLILVSVVSTITIHAICITVLRRMCLRLRLWLIRSMSVVMRLAGIRLVDRRRIHLLHGRHILIALRSVGRRHIVDRVVSVLFMCVLLAMLRSLILISLVCVVRIHAIGTALLRWLLMLVVMRRVRWRSAGMLVVCVLLRVVVMATFLVVLRLRLTDSGSYLRHRPVIAVWIEDSRRHLNLSRIVNVWPIVSVSLLLWSVHPILAGTFAMRWIVAS